MTQEDLENRFTYHPVQEGQAEKYATIRASILQVARMINTLVPDSREKSLAVTALEEACFWANAGIARNDG
jgi:hypothetical protein